MTDYQKMYQEKLTTPDKIAQQVQSGWLLGMDTATSQTPAIMTAIAERIRNSDITGVKVQALLGLDGDCDFSLRSSESYPFRCTKEDLLSLIDRQAQEAIPLMAHNSDYLVLNRRYAVYLPELLGDATTCHCELAV